jgi:hypothetical protein
MDRDGPHGLERVVRSWHLRVLSAPMLAFGATVARGLRGAAPTATYRALMGVLASPYSHSGSVLRSQSGRHGHRGFRSFRVGPPKAPCSGPLTTTVIAFECTCLGSSSAVGDLCSADRRLAGVMRHLVSAYRALSRLQFGRAGGFVGNRVVSRGRNADVRIDAHHS